MSDRQQDNEFGFPDVSQALEEPNGLLAVGGDLSPKRLIHAYRHGIFPWFNPGQPILWWSPDPRAVLFPDQLRVSRSLRKRLRQCAFQVTLDHSFEAVMRACAEPRLNQSGTWISEEMVQAYTRLHRQGLAHSVESWQDGALVGGLYGVAIGKVFFGESMFSRRTDASKVAFAWLVSQLQLWGFQLIDCQVETDHLASLGATTLPRHEFIDLLNRWCELPGHDGPWQFDTNSNDWNT